MPFTPFHFGAGALVHAAAPRRVSFLAFCAANVLIDVEPLACMLRGEAPVHRFAHTSIGAVLVALVTFALWLAAAKAAPVLRLPDVLGWRRLTAPPVAIGAALGSVSHVLLDSVMHADLRPFAPWSDANPLYGVVGLDALLGSCAVAALIGIVVAGVRHFRVESRASGAVADRVRHAGRDPR